MSRKHVLNSFKILLDPTMMTEMLKNNISNMVPMIVIGGVINWAFSGFLCSMCRFDNIFSIGAEIYR